MSLIYYRTDDQVVDIFTKPLTEAKIVKLRAMVGLQEAAIMGGRKGKFIPPPESPKQCVDGGVFEKLVHHIYGYLGDNQSTVNSLLFPTNMSSQHSWYLPSQARKVCMVECSSLLML